MASKLKPNGVIGRKLHDMANRRGRIMTDSKRFAPGHTMFGLQRRGYVVLKREGIFPTRSNIWHMTDKAWEAIGRTRPIEE